MASHFQNRDYEIGTGRSHGLTVLYAVLRPPGPGMPRLMLYRALYILLTGVTGRDSPLTISLWVLLISVSKFWPSKQFCM